MSISAIVVTIIANTTYQSTALSPFRPSPIPPDLPPVYCNEYLRMAYPIHWDYEDVDDFTIRFFDLSENASLSVSTTPTPHHSRPFLHRLGNNIGWGQIDPHFIHNVTKGDAHIGQNALDAYYINYTLSDPDYFPMRATEIFAENKPRSAVFHFHIEMDSKDYAGYLPFINNMMASFRLNNASDQYSPNDCEN